MSLGPPCPVCAHTDSDVVDSRFVRGDAEDDPTRRRRRRCGECSSTFTTREVIDEVQSSRGLMIPMEEVAARDRDQWGPEDEFMAPGPTPKRKTKRKVRKKVKPKALDAPRRRRINVRRDG